MIDGTMVTQSVLHFAGQKSTVPPILLVSTLCRNALPNCQFLLNLMHVSAILPKSINIFAEKK